MAWDQLGDVGQKGRGADDKPSYLLMLLIQLRQQEKFRLYHLHSLRIKRQKDAETLLYVQRKQFCRYRIARRQGSGISGEKRTEHQQLRLSSCFVIPYSLSFHQYQFL